MAPIRGKRKACTGKGRAGQTAPVRSACLASDAVLRTMLDSLPDCQVFVTDLNGCYIDANAFHLNALGANSLKAVLGRTAFDFLPKDVAQRDCDDAQKVMRTGRAVVDREESITVGKGAERWALTTRSPLRDGKGRIVGLLVVRRDVTDRKRAEETLALQKRQQAKRARKHTARVRELEAKLQSDGEDRQRVLRESEQAHGRMQAIMDNIPGCHLFIKDRQSRFIMSNTFTMKTLGVQSVQAIQGKTDFEFFPRELAERYYADEQNVMQTGQPIQNREEPCIDHDGQPMWLLTSKVPLRDPDGTVTGVVGISLDITELKKATDALNEERNLLRTLIDALPLRIYVKDLQSRFTVANKGLALCCGFANPEDMVGKTGRDLSAPEVAEPADEEEQALMKGGLAEVRRHMRVDEGNGRERILEVTKYPLRDSRGSITGLVGVDMEVTELWRSEAALRESQQRLGEERNLLRALIDNIPHDVYAKDIDGRFIVANAYLADTMSVSGVDVILGKTDFDFYPEELARQFQADEKAVIETGHSLVGKVEPKTLAGGEVRWIITTKLPLRDRDGKVVGIVGVGIDDTRRKAEEEKWRHLEEQLQHAEKLKAIGQLAGGVAHDFNNQLAAIMGSADMIRNWPDANDVPDLADTILTASKRAADLTSKLLAFARKGRYQLLPVNVHKIMAEVVSLLERSIKKRIRIVTRLNADRVMVGGDSSQLQNALLNIGINARDALKDEGEIVFATEAVVVNEEQCRGHSHELKAGPCIRIDISDNGMGMNEETKRHIFEPFFTTKGLAGNGMGLAAVYGTVRNHQGSISFTSELGRGTQFTIWLPLVKDDDVVAESPGVLVPVLGRARVLAVDDEPFVLGTIKGMLEKLGHTVTVCSDGREAVSHYEKSWRDIDLVLLDIEMPQMGGLDAFLAMHAINPSVRAVVLSGYSAAGNAQKLLKSGVRGFVQKPFGMGELSMAVAAALKA